ncbi:MAG TPA: GspH/FimT family pseudopilin [Alphaproteobacteria bacterium]
MTATVRKARAAEADRTRGFTLLELVVVLAIAAALFALALPSGARQRDHAEMANAARTVAAALRATRSKAITVGRPAAFAIDIASARYGAAGARSAEQLPRGTQVALVTTETERRGDTTGLIRFYPDGSSTGGGVSLSRGGDHFQVLVNWLTGGVSIHEQAAASR